MGPSQSPVDLWGQQFSQVSCLWTVLSLTRGPLSGRQICTLLLLTCPHTQQEGDTDLQQQKTVNYLLLRSLKSLYATMYKTLKTPKNTFSDIMQRKQLENKSGCFTSCFIGEEWRFFPVCTHWSEFLKEPLDIGSRQSMHCIKAEARVFSEAGTINLLCCQLTFAASYVLWFTLVLGQINVTACHLQGNILVLENQSTH